MVLFLHLSIYSEIRKQVKVALFKLRVKVLVKSLSDSYVFDMEVTYAYVVKGKLHYNLVNIKRVINSINSLQLFKVKIFML